MGQLNLMHVKVVNSRRRKKISYKGSYGMISNKPLIYVGAEQHSLLLHRESFPSSKLSANWSEPEV
jgi:hypothetical protein